jgi:hypothetical protein
LVAVAGLAAPRTCRCGFPPADARLRAATAPSMRLALGFARTLFLSLPPPGPRVVGHVPAASLQLEARVGDEPPHLALAGRAALQARGQ